MMRAIDFLLGAAAAAIVLAWAPAAASRATAAHNVQLPTFRSGAAAIAVDVSVRGSNRKPIANLTSADFEVYDDGVLQQVDDVTYGKLPIDIAVALDVSYSVTGRLLEQLRRSVVQLMRDLGPEDRLKLVLVNARISRAVDYTSDTRAVEEAMRAVEAGGGTSLFDALSVALVSANAPERRQLIVVFTDGRDSTSTTREAMLSEIALRTRATLAFVLPSTRPVLMSDARGYISRVRGLARPAVPSATFQALARDTGGSVLLAGTDTNLSATFRRVLDEFRSAYVLHYTARGVKAGGFHAIEVRVKRPGAQVQARRGYFGAASEGGGLP